MRCWVNFYGGKWALARRYGAPQREHVVEPFAGFAGYSTYWEPARVTLIEKDPMIIGVWRFLQRSSAKEILALPIVDHVDPPYQRAGYTYKYNHIDYSALAAWCKERRGYVQVCENTDANWLPFEPFSIVDSHRAHRLRRFSAEAIFESENQKKLPLEQRGGDAYKSFGFVRAIILAFAPATIVTQVNRHGAIAEPHFWDPDAPYEGQNRAAR